MGVPLNSKENRDSEKHKMAKWGQVLIFDMDALELLVVTEERVYRAMVELVKNRLIRARDL